MRILAELPFAKRIQSITCLDVSLSKISVWSLGLVPLMIPDDEVLIIGSRAKQEKIPQFIQLRVHTTKGGENNVR